MEKYYLQPGWDIVPCESGVELLSLKDNQKPIFLNNDPEFPNLVGFFEALRKGISMESALPGYIKLLSKLTKLGVIATKGQLKEISKPSNYLELLQKHFVGPGKLVNSLSTITATRAITVAEAVGLGARFIHHQPSLNYGWGADSSPLMANIKAVVECIERFALSDYEPAGFHKATCEEIRKNSMTAEQLNTTEARLENAGIIEWGKLEKLNGKGDIYAPLDFLHHPVDYWSLGRSPVCQMDISGVAGHQTKEAATVNALLELCEHEALMVTWFGQRTTPTIKHESLDEESRSHIAILEKMGWTVIVKDIGLDLVPVIMVVGIGPKGKRALTIGSSAAFTAKYAVKKAVLEVVRTVIYEEAKEAKTVSPKSKDVNDVRTHSLYYADHKNLKQAEHLWIGGEEIEAADRLTHINYRDRSLAQIIAAWEKDGYPEKHELDYLTEIFEAAGLDVYTCDITPRGVNVPLKVVRAIVPEMTRLVVGYGQKPAQTERLKALLKKYGNKRQLILSPVHPFS